MIGGLVGRCKNWFGAKGEAAADPFTPGTAVVPDEKTILAGREGNVMKTGKRYRKTSGHSPVFSLFTFFGLVQ